MQAACVLDLMLLVPAAVQEQVTSGRPDGSVLRELLHTALHGGPGRMEHEAAATVSTPATPLISPRASRQHKLRTLIMLCNPTAFLRNLLPGMLAYRCLAAHCHTVVRWMVSGTTWPWGSPLPRPLPSTCGTSYDPSLSPSRQRVRRSIALCPRCSARWVAVAQRPQLSSWRGERHLQQPQNPPLLRAWPLRSQHRKRAVLSLCLPQVAVLRIISPHHLVRTWRLQRARSKSSI